MTENNTNPILNDLFPAEQAWQLPSSATFGQLERALDSDDIDDVKLQLIHTWSHYQSLEFMLNFASIDPSMMARGIAKVYERELTPSEVEVIEASTRLTATALLTQAYHAAHAAMQGVQEEGITIQEALQILYPALSHDAPPREEPTMEELLGELMRAMANSPSAEEPVYNQD